MADYRYKAFISYSWADAAWGKWLHNAIETYRTPRALVDSEGAHGPVPARLHPLFKDREEEAAGASIGAAVEGALAASEFLIVVCSPNSARSKWVNHEVAWFKIHRDPSRILALIVDGEPGGGERECFPPALTHRVNSDLSISDELVDAPLAADARNSGDGKRGARLKLAAAMLGVGLDGLVRRDDRRRALRQRWITAGSLLFGGAMAALAWFALEARNEADYQRAQSDGLVEFMLTDLRERLEPVGRLDALDVVGQRALAYYAQQKTGSLDADALGRRSRALHLVGEVSNIRGDSAAGLKAFREAAKATAEQLVRDPDNPQRIFDHAQSVFWVGYIAYERKDLVDTERQFREYKRLADRLIAIEPGKTAWQLESSYAETNLGTLMFNQSRFSEAETAFELGLNRIEKVVAVEGYKPERQLELGTMLNWLGMTRSKLAESASSLVVHRREVAIYEEVLRRDPSDAAAKYRLAIALQWVGSAQCDLGDLRGAITTLNRSLELLSNLRAIEPANTEWQETQVRGLLTLVEFLGLARRFDDADKLLSDATALHAQMVKSDPTNKFWSGELRSMIVKADIFLALARGEAGRANRAGEEAVRIVKFIEDPAEQSELWRHVGDVQQSRGQRAQARESWQRALNGLPVVPGTQPERFRLLKRLGQTAEAARLATTLDKRGYLNPSYLRERK